MSGGIGGMLITAVETTKRVLAERALRDREAEIARVQEIGQVGGFDVHLRERFRSRRSREYLLIHGLPPEAANETHADWLLRVHPDDRAASERQFLDAIRGNGREYRIEYRIIRPSDGEVRWIGVRAEIERADDGAALRLVGANIDITDRKRAELAVQRLNETLEQQVAQRTRERDQLWRVSDDLIGVANFEGHWVSINPAATAILGWSQEELLAMPIASLWHPDDASMTFEHRMRLVQGGPTERFQNRYRHKDGSYRWLSWSSTAEGGFIYALGRDVTGEREAAESLRRTEEQLRQAQKMEAVGQLTGGIAHDFNNLLTGIIGSLDLMQKRVAQGRYGDIERYATMAKASANRAASLTHRLLAFARRQPLDPKPVERQLAGRLDGGALAAQRRRADPAGDRRGRGALADLLRSASARKRAAQPRDQFARRDARRRHGHDRNRERERRTGHAALRDVSPGQYVCLSVTDTGSGMSPAVQARAFDPFFTTKPIGQGTGLGLSMVYGFARQSEGHVRIHSEVDRGTTVELYLPRYRGAVEDAAGIVAAEGAAGALDGETVLVVEDEDSVRELVVEVLDDLGYRALEAADGPSGLQILRSSARIDLLVTDVGLPGMNGRQVADAAREQRPNLKVLFITGYAETAAMANGFLAPGMELVTKPFAVDALAARIRDMISA